MTLSWTWGPAANGGSGYANAGDVDPLNSGRIAIAGDTWGICVSDDHGANYYGVMNGPNTGTGNSPYGRAAWFSRRPATSGRIYWGLGGQHQPNAQGLAKTELGSNHTTYIDSTNGFGTNLGSGAGITPRACGRLIGSDYDSGGDHEYIYYATPTGLCRVQSYAGNDLTGGGAPHVLWAQSNNVFKALAVIDSQNVIFSEFYTTFTQVARSGKTYLANSATLRADSSVTPTALSNAPANVVDICVDPISGKVYAVSRSKVYYVHGAGYNTWDDISGSFFDDVVTTVAAYNDVLIVGQGDSAQSLPAGHSIAKSTAGSASTSTSWSWKTAAHGSTDLDSGKNWWLLTKTGYNGYIGGSGHDVSIAVIDPANPTHYYDIGRGGVWTSRDSGATWHPSMNGLNGDTESAIAISGTTVWFASNDWTSGKFSRSDSYATCVWDGSPPAFGAGHSSFGPITLSDGHSYVFAVGTGGMPGTITAAKDGGAPASIADTFFQGHLRNFSDIKCTSDGYLFIAMGAGGTMMGTPSSAPPPSNFGFPVTGDGVIHRASSLHYFGGGIVGDATHTAAVNAQRYAQLYDIVIGNIQMNASTNAIVTDKFNGLAPIMRQTKSAMGLGGYNKSVQVYEGAPGTSYYPNAYYAHAAPWPTGAVPLQFGGKYPVAQPSVVAGQPNFADPRGWTATSFREQRARDVLVTQTRYNALNSNALNCVHLDSMGTGSIFNQVKPEDGSLYSNDKPSWLQLVWSIGDETRSRKPDPSIFLVGNGLSNGQAYNGLEHDLVTHVDGAIAENWIHDNYVTTPPGFRAETGSNSFQSDIDMAFDVQARGIWFWGVTNIGNDTAGNPPSGLSQAQYMAKWTSAQLEQMRRYALATGLLCDRGKLWVEYVQETAISPWDEDHPYYHVALGAPVNATPATHADLLQASGAYMRDYATGTVWVNAKATSVTVPLTTNYADPAGIGSGTYASGTNLTIPPNTGLVLIKTTGARANSEDPTVAITSPTGSPTININSITATGTASDPDGIATGEFKLDSGSWVAGTFLSGSWTKTFTGLSAGAHTITFRATDANPSPRTGTTSAAAFTYTVPDTTPPVISVSTPTDGTIVIGQVGVTVPVTGVVTDTGSSIASFTVNGVAVAVDSTGHFSTNVALAVGANPIVLAATDGSGNPTTTTVTVTLTLQTSGGGGGDQTIVISTDIQDIELRIHQRGLQ